MKTILALFLACSFALGQTSLVAIKAGKLIDGKSEKPFENVVIIVEGSKVKEVGTRIPSGATVIDLSNSTVLPGLIDCHTHVLLQGDITAEDYDKQLLKESIPYRTLRASRACKTALMNGFTTIRDLETEGAMYADVDLKKAINGGVVDGPRMFVATRAINSTGRYGLSNSTY